MSCVGGSGEDSGEKKPRSESLSEDELFSFEYMIGDVDGGIPWRNDMGVPSFVRRVLDRE